jgi:hypothetical protein
MFVTWNQDLNHQIKGGFSYSSLFSDLVEFSCCSLFKLCTNISVVVLYSLDAVVYVPWPFVVQRA